MESKLMKCILAIVMVIVIATSSYAQQNNDQSEAQAKQLQTQLSLTDAQTQKVKLVYQQMAKDKAADKTTQAKLKSWSEAHDMKSIYTYLLKEFDANGDKVKAALTPRQKMEYDKILAKQRDAINNMIKMTAAQQH